MKVRSDRLHQNDFEINNIQGNECNVVFFDTKNHKEEKDENENKEIIIEREDKNQKIMNIRPKAYRIRLTETQL